MSPGAISDGRQRSQRIPSRNSEWDSLARTRPLGPSPEAASRIFGVDIGRRPDESLYSGSGGVGIGQFEESDQMRSQHSPIQAMRLGSNTPPVNLRTHGAHGVLPLGELVQVLESESKPVNCTGTERTLPGVAQGMAPLRHETRSEELGLRIQTHQRFMQTDVESPAAESDSQTIQGMAVTPIETTHSPRRNQEHTGTGQQQLA